MVSRPLLAYFIASSNARAMDARGEVPGRFMRALVMIPAALFVLGMGGIFIAFLVSFTAWKLGIG